MFVLVLALVVAIAIKIVGVLLTIAFLIMPAAAARPLSETPEQMALFAAIFGALSVALGLFVSVTFDTPGGPSIVLMLALFFVAAIFPTVLRGGGTLTLSRLHERVSEEPLSACSPTLVPAEEMERAAYAIVLESSHDQSLLPRRASIPVDVGGVIDRRRRARSSCSR